jgi:hypothetical protein
MTLTSNLNRRLARAGAPVAVLLGLAVAGCGSSSPATSAKTITATPSAFTSTSANPVAVPPVSDAALVRGSAQHQITQAIVAFYRSAWEDDATQACALFSPTGRAGFMHAASISFPQSINKLSTCQHAMEIYNATLGDSATTAEDNDTSFSTSALDHVGVAGIRIVGATASAIAPTNVVDLINPERFVLVRLGGRWLINGSQSLNKSNLGQILARAKAKGELTPKKGRSR